MTQPPPDRPELLLRPAEVAARLGVTPKTVANWARAGKIRAVRTIGGHRRIPLGEVHRILAEREVLA